MRLMAKNDLCEVYDTDAGTRVVLQRDNSSRGIYWSVYIKHDDLKGRIVATRCNYEKAIDIAKHY